MAKLSEKYEAMIVFSVKNGEDAVKALEDKFNEMITAAGSDVTMDEWGKRKLAYAINYETEGFYVVWNFTAAPAFPAELERILNITDGVLRFLVTKA